ncbi:unnamed protein product [Clonostachys byssicola]|uniref:Uncharacterized protein n=1 Tax=Clonostachys byssicola TaxID=160290 RepID=A0A9N9Y3Y4_9HYPO|nr:unnamed protein product [Clonostachys byssicola]
MALEESKLPTKESWFFTGPAVKGLKPHRYSIVLLHGSENQEEEEKHLSKLAVRSRYEESVKFHIMRERIATLEWRTAGDPVSRV